jgi:hypothetical protein
MQINVIVNERNRIIVKQQRHCMAGMAPVVFFGVYVFCAIYHGAVWRIVPDD